MNMLKKSGHPKSVNYFHIPLINSEIIWVSRKSAEDRKNGGVTDRDSGIQIKTGAFKQAPVFLIRV
ncbi:MAG TPA: hypothetical protein DDZ69_02995 [Porphyromonadaceae bacterium]|nr:hypothetical protein [Porphyromonadaceae bacterium]HCA99819.1 hypothetical protein [Porphyromonadaceae bacterium]